MDNLTVALDITITDQLKSEGMAREIINRIQNYRKDQNFEVTDKINLTIEKNSEFEQSIIDNNSYICSETLANSLILIDEIEAAEKIEVELIDNIKAHLLITKAD